MRSFATVSISPWANPYNGATNTGQNYYTATADPTKPVYRRIVAPPAPNFFHPGIEQVIDDSDDDAGGAPVDPSAPPKDAASPVTPKASPPPPPTAPSVDAPDAQVTASTDDAPLPPPTSPSPRPPQSSDGDTDAPAIEVITQSCSSTKGGTNVVVGDASADREVTIVDIKDEPPGPCDSGNKEVPALLPSRTPDPLLIDSPATPTSSLCVDSVPEPSVVGSEKSGESEQAAQAVPKSPVFKSVHFASDTKDPDAGNSKKKKKLLIGKGKPYAFVRMRDPPPPSTTSPKDEKKKIVDKAVKKKERRPSFLSISSAERSAGKEGLVPSLKKPNKTEDRKQKKIVQEKTVKVDESEPNSGSPSSKDRAVLDHSSSVVEAADSIITTGSTDASYESQDVVSEEAAPTVASPPPPTPPSDERGSETPEFSLEHAGPPPPPPPPPLIDAESLPMEEASNVEMAPSEGPASEGLALEEPSLEKLPSEEPSSEEPPSEETSLEDPSSEEPLSEDPSSEEPPSEEPPLEDLSLEELPLEEPPSEDPSSEEPPSEEPSSEEPPSEEPSSEEPPSEEPPSEVAQTAVEETQLVEDSPAEQGVAISEATPMEVEASSGSLPSAEETRSLSVPSVEIIEEEAITADSNDSQSEDPAPSREADEAVPLDIDADANEQTAPEEESHSPVLEEAASGEIQDDELCEKLDTKYESLPSVNSGLSDRPAAPISLDTADDAKPDAEHAEAPTPGSIPGTQSEQELLDAPVGEVVEEDDSQPDSTQACATSETEPAEMAQTPDPADDEIAGAETTTPDQSGNVQESETPKSCENHIKIETSTAEASDATPETSTGEEPVSPSELGAAVTLGEEPAASIEGSVVDATESLDNAAETDSLPDGGLIEEPALEAPAAEDMIAQNNGQAEAVADESVSTDEPASAEEVTEVLPTASPVVDDTEPNLEEQESLEKAPVQIESSPPCELSATDEPIENQWLVVDTKVTQPTQDPDDCTEASSDVKGDSAPFLEPESISLGSSEEQLGTSANENLEVAAEDELASTTVSKKGKKKKKGKKNKAAVTSTLPNAFIPAENSVVSESVVAIDEAVIKQASEASESEPSPEDSDGSDFVPKDAIASQDLDVTTDSDLPDANESKDVIAEVAALDDPPATSAVDTFSNTVEVAENASEALAAGDSPNTSSQNEDVGDQHDTEQEQEGTPAISKSEAAAADSMKSDARLDSRDAYAGAQPEMEPDAGEGEAEATDGALPFASGPRTTEVVNADSEATGEPGEKQDTQEEDTPAPNKGDLNNESELSEAGVTTAGGPELDQDMQGEMAPEEETIATPEQGTNESLLEDDVEAPQGTIEEIDDTLEAEKPLESLPQAGNILPTAEVTKDSVQDHTPEPESPGHTEEIDADVPVVLSVVQGEETPRMENDDATSSEQNPGFTTPENKHLGAQPSEDSTAAFDVGSEDQSAKNQSHVTNEIAVTSLPESTDESPAGQDTAVEHVPPNFDADPEIETKDTESEDSNGSVTKPEDAAPVVSEVAMAEGQEPITVEVVGGTLSANEDPTTVQDAAAAHEDVSSTSGTTSDEETDSGSEVSSLTPAPLEEHESQVVMIPEQTTVAGSEVQPDDSFDASHEIETESSVASSHEVATENSAVAELNAEPIAVVAEEAGREKDHEAAVVEPPVPAMEAELSTDESLVGGPNQTDSTQDVDADAEFTPAKVDSEPSIQMDESEESHDSAELAEEVATVAVDGSADAPTPCEPCESTSVEEEASAEEPSLHDTDETGNSDHTDHEDSNKDSSPQEDDAPETGDAEPATSETDGVVPPQELVETASILGIDIMNASIEDESNQIAMQPDESTNLLPPSSAEDIEVLDQESSPGEADPESADSGEAQGPSEKDLPQSEEENEDTTEMEIAQETPIEPAKEVVVETSEAVAPEAPIIEESKSADAEDPPTAVEMEASNANQNVEQALIDDKSAEQPIVEVELATAPPTSAPEDAADVATVESVLVSAAQQDAATDETQSSQGISQDNGEDVEVSPTPDPSPAEPVAVEEVRELETEQPEVEPELTLEMDTKSYIEPPVETIPAEGQSLPEPDPATKATEEEEALAKSTPPEPEPAVASEADGIDAEIVTAQDAIFPEAPASLPTAPEPELETIDTATAEQPGAAEGDASREAPAVTATDEISVADQVKGNESKDQEVRVVLDQGPVVDQIVDDSGPRERDVAVADGFAAEPAPREKQRRRHSHTHHDSKHHSHRRRESEASTKERPVFGGLAGVLAAAKLAGATKSKRRDSITERDTGKGKERRREGSDSSKERMYPEHRPHRHRESRGEDKRSKRRTVGETNEDLERQKRRELRAGRERLEAEEAAKIREDEEAQRQERRERRIAAKQAEDERLRAEAERRQQKEDERIAREEEERRVRHEKRRQRHEARRLESERAEQAEHEEEEARRLRRQRRAEREKEKEAVLRPRPKKEVAELTRDTTSPSSRDAARRAFEEDDEDGPPPPSTPPPPPIVPESPPRSAPRRRMSTREPPPTAKRNSILSGFSLFGRSKTDTASPTPKSVKPVARVRSEAIEQPETPVRALKKETERPSSSHQSSHEGRDRAERPHRSRRQSHGQRQKFKTATEEEEHYRRKIKLKSTRYMDHEMSGGRDGGISLIPHADELPPPPPEPFEPGPGPGSDPIAEPELEQNVRAVSPFMDDAAAELGVVSTSSAERRERRRARRVSSLEERPKSRRITVTEKERPAGRRIESDRPRTRGHDEERPRPRRGETERRSSGTHRSSRKKEESRGLKSLFGGLKKTFA